MQICWIILRMGEFHLSLKPFGVCEFNLATQWSSRSSNVFLSTVVLMHFVNACFNDYKSCMFGKVVPWFLEVFIIRNGFCFFSHLSDGYIISHSMVFQIFQHIDAWDKAYMKLNIYLISFYNLHGALWRMFFLYWRY